MKIQLVLISILLIISCKKYKDPNPFSDPRIVNKYCNIPSAINYNWNFPGVPDDSQCIFPAQIYNGTYIYYDSIFNNTGLFISDDTFNLNFMQIDTTRMQITGFCAGNTIYAKATRFYKFTIDSIAGTGQLLCNITDTIAGKGSKFDLTDTTTIKMEYTIYTDTGIIYHAGTAIKQ